MIALVVPTLNAGDGWRDWIRALAAQSLLPDRVLIIDSSSQDCTVPLAREAGYEVLTINRADFNHGSTRQLGADHLATEEILIYLTQDAVLADRQSLENLVKCFSDNAVGAAYGRQLPHHSSGPIGAHARIFNYGNKSEIRSMSDVPQLGIKTAFISDSFAAYRRSALMKLGGFPSDVIFGEDAFVGAKLVLEGWKMAYCACATVRHSHDYTFVEEFSRYFDIGVFHAHEPWIRKTFGAPEGEGKRFVLSEMMYLANKAPWLIPSALLRTGLKYLGFRLGLMERKLPLLLKQKIGMHKAYWD